MSCCLVHAAVPAKRVWLSLGALLGLRPTKGLGELHKVVRTCEYRDIHVMWELLGGTDPGAPPNGAAGIAGKKQIVRRRRRRKAGASAAAWSRLFSSCCAF